MRELASGSRDRWLRDVVAQATGTHVGEGCRVPVAGLGDLETALTGGEARQQAVPGAVSEWLTAGGGTPEPDAAPVRARLARWPGDRPFALFLSHDVDQIFDRELFRVLADVNHIRRRFTDGEPGSTRLALRRVARALLKPKPTSQDFQEIVNLEGRHGFRSTFFLLHDRYWARNGARYRIDHPVLAEIASEIRAAGCELGLHGGYYRFNDAQAYRESRDLIGELFGCEPIGIRNHHLRFSYPHTWRAQVEAGFSYDATYGSSTVAGPRSLMPLPFQVFDREADRPLDLIELPLTLMDNTLFRVMRRTTGDTALKAALSIIEPVIGAGGLVSLLWHNNYFNEPEYEVWHQTYRLLLETLAAQKPWCATGGEIAGWWRRRARVRVENCTTARGWRVVLKVPEPLDDVVLYLGGAAIVHRVSTQAEGVTVARAAEGWRVRFDTLVDETMLVMEQEGVSCS